MHFEAEAAQSLDLVRIEVEHDRLDVAGQEQARHDLSEAAKASDDDRSLFEVLVGVGRQASSLPPQEACVERQKDGGQHHGQGDGQREQRLAITR